MSCCDHLSSVRQSIHLNDFSSKTPGPNFLHVEPGGWSGGVKVSCSLRHRGVQLILAYS